MKDSFVCPDGEQILISDCLLKCRMDEVCCSEATRRLVSENRPWGGSASPSMAGKGVRQAYLEYTNNFAIKPTDQIFAVYGTRHHAQKEEVMEDHGQTEMSFEDGGTVDLYDHKKQDLWDYKLVGAYAVSKRARIDIEGTGNRYKSGKRAGEERTRKVFKGWAVNRTDEWALQMNYYRIKAEREEKPVQNMYIEVTIRDGKEEWYGLDRKVYVIPIPHVEDEIVIQTYDLISYGINEAMNSGITPDVCSEEERWEGRKCKDYCPVWDHCIKLEGLTKKEKEDISKHKEGK